jgi:hypothetical protein
MMASQFKINRLDIFMGKKYNLLKEFASKSSFSCKLKSPTIFLRLKKTAGQNPVQKLNYLFNFNSTHCRKI